MDYGLVSHLKDAYVLKLIIAVGPGSAVSDKKRDSCVSVVDVIHGNPGHLQKALLSFRLYYFSQSLSELLDALFGRKGACPSDKDDSDESRGNH